MRKNGEGIERIYPLTEIGIQLIVEFQSKLEVPGLQSRADRTKAAGRKAVLRDQEIGVVGDVEGLEAKFDPGVLGRPELSEDRQIQVDDTRALQAAPPGVAVG